MEEFEYIGGKEDEVCINIAMFVYNHSSYLRQALDSVFMQKTQYSYRVIVGEDCSTDDTRDILMEYYKKYPDKMELLLFKHNVGGEKNSVEVLKKCRAKYVAYLEGDDYWTDPLKLEKQVSFLERNRQYIGTSHNVRGVDQNGAFLHRDYHLYPYQEEHIYGQKNVRNVELVGQMATLLHRNIWQSFGEKDWQRYLACDTNGDLKISLILGVKGDLYFLSDIMADHRRVFEGESWTAQSVGKNMLMFSYRTRAEVQNYFLEAFDIDLEIPLDRLARRYVSESLVQVLCRPSKENIRILLKICREKRRHAKR